MAIDLLAATSRLMLEVGVRHLIAVFDRAMQLQYRRSGVPPKLLGTMSTAEGQIFAGRWTVNRRKSNQLMQRAQLDDLTIHLGLANAPGLRHLLWLNQHSHNREN